jgi:hypothetical protein
MGTQISIKLSDKMFTEANRFADLKGFDTLQDFIRELLREKLFESKNENIGGLYTTKASEDSLAKNWLLAEEDEAWDYLQKGI